MGTFKLVLDYAGVEPNPARDRRAKPPHQEAKQPNVPAHPHPGDPRPPPRTPPTGLRHPRSNRHPYRGAHITHLGRPRHRGIPGQDHPRQNRPAQRWVKLPPGLTDNIDATRPPGDNTTRRLLPHLTDSTIQRAIRKACEHAGTPRYTPCDLRHRWISLALKRGLPQPRSLNKPATHANQSPSTPAATSSPNAATTTPSPWETYGHRTDTTPQHTEPNRNNKMHGPRTEAPPPHDKTTCKRLPFRKCHGIVPTLRGSRKTVPTLHGPTPPTDFWPQSRTAPRGRAARSRRGQGATPTQAGRPDISGGQIETRAGGNPRSAPTNGRPVSPTARLTQALSATGSPQHSQPSVWKSPDGSAPRNAR